MARSGLLKSQVKYARAAVIAKGTYPSADAVRQELGNTGSKTTIHKYLKELEEEDAGSDRIALSEPLQDLVERLSMQLQGEADARIAAAQVEQARRERQHVEAVDLAKHEARQLDAELQRLKTLLTDEQESHARTNTLLQEQTIARHTADQQVVDLRERLAENESHRLSLEEKHQHARDALEHYRTSVKEQREQDQRRHEQQVQQLQAELRQAQQTIVIRQQETTRLNQEGIRLVTDLSHAQKVLYDEQANGRQLATKLAPLQERCATLEAQLADKAEIKAQLAAAVTALERSGAQVRELELALATANAKLSAQQDLAGELRTYLAKQGVAASNEAAQ